MTAAELAKATDTTSDMCVNGCARRRRPDFVEYDAGDGQVFDDRGAGGGAGHEGSPFYFLGAIEVAVAMMQSRAADSGSVPDRQGRGLART